MLALLYIFIGGGVGALSRYGLYHSFSQETSHWATLTANGVGSFLMGVAIILLPKYLSNDPTIQNAITIGFLGALTTFSTFSYDSYYLWTKGETQTAIIYIIGSVIISISAFVFGLWLTQFSTT